MSAVSMFVLVMVVQVLSHSGVKLTFLAVVQMVEMVEMVEIFGLKPTTTLHLS
jgi:hypothetical protein